MVQQCSHHIKRLRSRQKGKQTTNFLENLEQGKIFYSVFLIRACIAPIGGFSMKSNLNVNPNCKKYWLATNELAYVCLVNQSYRLALGLFT